MVSECELRKLYLDERMSTPQIAAILGTSKTNVNRWIRNAGIPLRSAEEGKRLFYANGGHPHNFKGRVMQSAGYILIYAPDHPRARAASPNSSYRLYVYEHILVWEKYHNKLLPKNWIIHHINGIKSDNRPENLVAMPRGKHAKVIPEMAKRIRQLEIENDRLKKSGNYPMTYSRRLGCS